MGYVREHRRGSRVYYEEVEGYRDSEGRVRQRRIRWLGTSPTPPPNPVDITGAEFGAIAIPLMQGTLTPDELFLLLETMGKKPVPVPDLEAIGIRFDIAQKKLALHYYPKEPSSRARGSSPSKDKRD